MTKRLSEIIQACDKPFKWGTNDCCTLLHAAVNGKTDRDILRGFRGYRTRKGAAKKLREKGKGTLLDTLIDLLGEPIPVAQARPGDIVMADSWRVGVCAGKVTALIGDEGIVYTRTLDCERAFRNG